MAAKPGQARLGGVIGGKAAARRHACDGGDEDDRRIVGQFRQCVFHPQHVAGQIDGHHFFPAFQRGAFEPWPARANAEVQHQPIQIAETRDRFFDHALDLIVFGCVRFDGEGMAVFAFDQRNGCGCTGPVAIGHGDTGPFAGEQHTHRPSIADGRVRLADVHLAATHHKDAAALQPPARGRLSLRFRRQIGCCGRHGRFPSFFLTHRARPCLLSARLFREFLCD